MGRHYLGNTPCIPPLAMAELMIRLENRRQAEWEERTAVLTTAVPRSPVARFLAFLRTLFG